MSIMLVLQCFVIILCFLYWLTRNKDFEKVPGPPGTFILHHTLDIVMDPVKLFYYFRHLCNKYKRLFRLQLGTVKAIVVHNPEDVEVMTSSVIFDVNKQNIFQKEKGEEPFSTYYCHLDLASTIISGSKYNNKGFVYSFIQPWLKEGLVTSRDQKWIQRRKMLAPAFSYNILANFMSVIEENCQEFLGKLKPEINNSRTDITPFINDFTLNTICETAMDAKLDDDVSNIGKKYKNGIYEMGQQAVHRAQRIWMYPKCIFKLTKIGRKQNETLEVLSSFRDKVIESRRKLRNTENDKTNESTEINGKRKKVLIDLLLQSETDGLINMKGIGEEVDTFIFGGHDTTANALQFTLLLLANNQNEQEKVVKELNDVFGTSDRAGTMADLSQMKYMECCIKETLRLYPPLPLITRTIQEPLKLGEYEVPVGTECAIFIYDLQRRGDQFVEPLRFNPERFQAEPTWHPYAYIPFSAGPRNCIGQKFAMMEMKLLLSAFLRRYRVLPVTKPEDIIFVTDYVLRHRDPIYIKIEKRQIIR